MRIHGWGAAALGFVVSCTTSHRDAIDAGSDASASARVCPTSPPTPTLVATTPANELLVVGDTGSAGGIFDPSLVYPSGAAAGAMSYSSVPDRHSIRVRIALSADLGASWYFEVEATTPTAAAVTSSDPSRCGGATCDGFFIDEVSSLIIDPDDPDPARRWKLYTHRYLAEADDTLHYDFGSIALYTASAPDGPWSAPVPLLGWPSTSSVSSAGALNLTSSIEGIDDCLFLTEPSALWVPGQSIDLAFGCPSLVAGEVQLRIVLLRSTDHGATFRFVSDLLTADDARCFGDGSPRMNAANLFFAGGVEYLIASHDSESLGYEGCHVFEVPDPVAGAIARDAHGAPIVTRHLAPSPTRFAGACTYAEGASALGYVLPAAFITELPRVFRIFGSTIAAP